MKKDRSICCIEDCTKLCMSKGYGNFAKMCAKHHRQKYSMSTGNQRNRLKHRLDNECIVCGWDKGPCDLHRISPGSEGGRYTTNNVIVLCPNCHRLVHSNLLQIQQD